MDAFVARTSWLLVLALSRASCAPAAKEPAGDSVPAAAKALPPVPTVTWTAADSMPGQRIEHGEVIVDVDAARRALHAQHHSHAVLETRRAS